MGRAGTVASCVLVARGVAPDAAIAQVRAARPGAVENAHQERFVAAFAAARRERG
jgi:protein-tyrosine phosphatase